jgi:hypothetical protein
LTNPLSYGIIKVQKRDTKEATIMMEFGIINYKTGERDVMFGYNVMDAFKRSGKDMIDWVVEYVEFID